ncbi:MAG: hypothetical protein J6C29_01145 [Clostridia bacterium]|nr:hypothetical protein [Clostridia bacterium]
MPYMLCWCCEYFVFSKEIQTDKETEFYGICKKNGEICFSQACVCEDFILKSGLHTTRIIPDFYNK